MTVDDNRSPFCIGISPQLKNLLFERFHSIQQP
jgi:hypothetical protein